jgi:hypothetical protein
MDMIFFFFFKVDSFLSQFCFFCLLFSSAGVAPAVARVRDERHLLRAGGLPPSVIPFPAFAL